MLRGVNVIFRAEERASDRLAARTGIEPGKLLVAFFSARPDREVRDKVFGINAGREELHIDGRELYLYFPDGQGRSKLSLPLVEKTLKTHGTGRNWNTVAKLLEMAERLEFS